MAEVNGDRSWFKQIPSWLAAAGLLLAITVLAAWLIEATQERAGFALHPVGAWIVARPESDAQRLGINDAQRVAWEEFKRARWAWVRAAAGLPPFPPQMLTPSLSKGPAGEARADILAAEAVLADPAVEDRVVADAAPAEGARTSLEYAEATRKLRAVLSPEQRRTLDDSILEAPHRPGHNLRLLALSLMFVCKPS